MAIVHATPEDVCRCGHKKMFHVWLNTLKRKPGESIVLIRNCDHSGCECPMYDESLPTPQTLAQGGRLADAAGKQKGTA